MSSGAHQIVIQSQATFPIRISSSALWLEWDRMPHAFSSICNNLRDLLVKADYVEGTEEWDSFFLLEKNICHPAKALKIKEAANDQLESMVANYLRGIQNKATPQRNLFEPMADSDSLREALAESITSTQRELGGKTIATPILVRLDESREFVLAGIVKSLSRPECTPQDGVQRIQGYVDAPSFWKNEIVVKSSAKENQRSLSIDMRLFFPRIIEAMSQCRPCTLTIRELVDARERVVQVVQDIEVISSDELCGN